MPRLPNTPMLRTIFEGCVACVLLICSGFLAGCEGNSAMPTTGNGSTGSGAAYPLKVSANSRYLVDQNNQPFLLVGDAPQTIISLIPLTGTIPGGNAPTYFSTRQGQGFNAIWTDVLCDKYMVPFGGGTGCNSGGHAFDGTPPFTSGTAFDSSGTIYDISTPNPAYFAEIDSLVKLAAQYGFLVLLDPAETGGLAAAGGFLETNCPSGNTTKCYNYGQYLGNRYKSFPNIVWFTGNDFQNWSSDSVANADVVAIAQGIHDAEAANGGTPHLQTAELEYNESCATDDSLLAPLITQNLAYTYSPAYDRALSCYNHAPVTPVVLGETFYESSNLCGGGHGTPFNLRHQQYWTMTSGANGYVNGNDAWITFFTAGWQNNLNTPGEVQFGAYWRTFFQAIPWYNLVPDQSHTLVTSGYGTYLTANGSCNGAAINSNNYVTAALTSDNTTAVIYFPQAATITVNMAPFAAPVTAQWFDPSNGAYTLVSGSPFANAGTQQFSSPGSNSAGDPDWVLRLQVPSK